MCARGVAPAGVFRMPARRLLAHYKIDPERNRLLMVACNAEDMLLPRSNFTFYGQHLAGTNLHTTCSIDH